MINLKSYIRDIIYLFYPESCAACNKALFDNEKWVCSPCFLQLPYTESHIDKDSRYNRIFWGRTKVEQVWPFLEYKRGLKTQKILHKIKYKNQPELGVYFGEIAAKTLLNKPELADLDFIVPVPMHYKKQRLRGYNQAEYIAKGFEKVLGKPINTGLVQKNINSESQTKKNRLIRGENSQKVFSVKNESALLKLNKILIIDDVITTGATLEALITSILAKNPEIKIYVATLAAA